MCHVAFKRRRLYKPAPYINPTFPSHNLFRNPIHPPCSFRNPIHLPFSICKFGMEPMDSYLSIVFPQYKHTVQGMPILYNPNNVSATVKIPPIIGMHHGFEVSLIARISYMNDSVDKVLGTADYSSAVGRKAFYVEDAKFPCEVSTFEDIVYGTLKCGAAESGYSVRYFIKAAVNSVDYGMLFVENEFYVALVSTLADSNTPWRCDCHLQDEFVKNIMVSLELEKSVYNVGQLISNEEIIKGTIEHLSYYYPLNIELHQIVRGRTTVFGDEFAVIKDSVLASFKFKGSGYSRSSMNFKGLIHAALVPTSPTLEDKGVYGFFTVEHVVKIFGCAGECVGIHITPDLLGEQNIRFL